MTKGWFNLEIGKFQTKLGVLRKKAHKVKEGLETDLRVTTDFINYIDEAELNVGNILLMAKAYRESMDAYSDNQVERKVRTYDVREKAHLRRIKELEVIEAEYNKLVSSDKAIVTQAEQNQVSKARTLAIYDSIIFAISNWSDDGQTAPDVELACQAVLFPCIYQKVMEGVEDYYFDEVPTSALLVVQRGREYVRHLREENDRFITDPSEWEHSSALIRDWWINDGLPILYGARDDDWETVSPKTLEEMIVWRDQPASRALDFPLIWDGMELVKQYSEQIRESSGLASFNKQQLSTRLTP